MTPEDRLRPAFLATSYGTARDRFRLSQNPGPPCPLFEDGVPWAIVTAHNPDAVQRAAALNDAAQRRLEACVGGRPWLAGVNGEGEWAEASLIVPGMTLAEALELGRAFGQVAVLHGVGQRAALVWRDAGPEEWFWVSGFRERDTQ